jgi:hypothetical protein
MVKLGSPGNNFWKFTVKISLREHYFIQLYPEEPEESIFFEN